VESLWGSLDLYRDISSHFTALLEALEANVSSLLEAGRPAAAAAAKPTPTPKPAPDR
jgi:hypothetical protein